MFLKSQSFCFQIVNFVPKFVHQVTRGSPGRHSLTPRNPCGSPRSGLSMSLLDGSPTPSPGHRAALRGQTLAPQNIDRAMFIKLVTLLEEVKDTLKLHGQMLNALLKKNSIPVMAIPDGAVFPLANVEDVIAMNEKLSDPEFISAVVSFWGPDLLVFLCFLSSDKILLMLTESLNFAEFKSHEMK